DDGRGDAKPVHRINDGLALPTRQTPGDLAMLLKWNGQKNDVRLDGFPQRPGDDRGPDRLRQRRQGFGRPPTGDGDFDVFAGKGAGEGLAHCAETDDCVSRGIIKGIELRKIHVRLRVVVATGRIVGSDARSEKMIFCDSTYLLVGWIANAGRHLTGSTSGLHR